MKKALLTVVGAMLVFGCASRKQTVAPFPLPEGVVYEAQDDIGFRSFRWGADDAMALFMMSPHPAGLSRDMVDKMASDTASKAEPEFRKIEGVDTLKKEAADISAGDFTGKEVVFTVGMSDGKTICQSLYVLWDGSRLWQGQMTGSRPEDLQMVRSILDSMGK